MPTPLPPSLDIPTLAAWFHQMWARDLPPEPEDLDMARAVRELIEDRVRLAVCECNRAKDCDAIHEGDPIVAYVLGAP